MSEDERLAGLQVGVTEAQAAAFAEMQQKAFRCEAAEAQLAKAREALEALERDFSRMPDAGLTADDPRSAWWFETADTRKAAREALATGDET